MSKPISTALAADFRTPILFLALFAGAASGPRSAAPLAAQTAPLRLTLDQAVEMAREGNPGFQTNLNDRNIADWDVRAAYAALLPSASLGGGVSWQGSGDQTIGTLTAGQLGFGDQPDFYTSSYNLSLGLQISGAALYAPGQAQAARERTSAQVRAAAVTLEQQVATAYLEVLRQQEEVALANSQRERSTFNLRLAEARRDVGEASQLDVQQASVQVGRSDVTVLLAEQALRTARLRFLQILGLELNRDFELVTDFELLPPTWDPLEVYNMALSGNPSLEVQRRARQVADYDVSISRSRYFPSLSISTGFGGFAREASDVGFEIRRTQAQIAGRIASCEQQNELFSRLADPLPTQDCSRFAFTDEMRRSIIEENDVFPFGFTNSAPSVSLGVSLPIFQGLSRQRQLEASNAARQDLDFQIREQELALRADIAVGLGRVETAYQSALIEESNQGLADEQLRLAREQYAVGLISFADLVDAETVKAEADRARIAAIYAYHDALIALEATVGASLRNGSQP